MLNLYFIQSISGLPANKTISQHLSCSLIYTLMAEATTIQRNRLVHTLHREQLAVWYFAQGHFDWGWEWNERWLDDRLYHLSHSCPCALCSLSSPKPKRHLADCHEICQREFQILCLTLVNHNISGMGLFSADVLIKIETKLFFDWIWDYNT